jgi:hypothetical protein
MRQVYRLLGLVRRHGADAVDDACRRALNTEVIDVGLIDHMCSRGNGEQLPFQPAPSAASRFVRASTDFAVRRPRRRLQRAHHGPGRCRKNVSGQRLRAHRRSASSQRPHRTRRQTLQTPTRSSGWTPPTKTRCANCTASSCSSSIYPGRAVISKCARADAGVVGTLHVWREAGTRGRCDSGTARNLLSWKQGAPARGGTMPTIAWTCSDGPLVGFAGGFERKLVELGYRAGGVAMHLRMMR